jgi:hypothetical protein
VAGYYEEEGLTMELHPDVIEIRRAAPKRARFLGVSPGGSMYWNDSCCASSAWLTGDSKDAWFSTVDRARIERPGTTNFGIDLLTGAIRICDEAGRIVTVPQKAWVAARRRKAKR